MKVFYSQNRHKFVIQKEKTWEDLDVDGMDSLKKTYDYLDWIIYSLLGLE